jgi:hypothetical protein
MVRLDFQQGDVAAFVGADHLGLEFATIGKAYRNLLGTLNHVIIGQDVTVTGNDEPGAERLGLVFLRHVTVALVLARVAEKVLEEIIERRALRQIRYLDAFRQTHTAGFDLLRGADIDHRVAGVFHQFGKVGQVPRLRLQCSAQTHQQQ